MDQATLKSWLTYHPETGVFTWAQSRDQGKVKVGHQAGCLHPDGYVKIRLFNRMYRNSRLAVLYMTGVMPAFVDHIDCDRSNDRWANLRVCTRSQNQFNRSKQANNTSGFKGVLWHKQTKKWWAKIGYHGKSKSLGLFNSPEIAAAAYARAAKELHGSFARTT
jgi:Demerecviridae HNH endonuclease